MRDFSDATRRLAELAVGFGVNLQPGQVLAVSSFTGKEEATRAVARAAYERGARWVDVLYFDPWIKRERIAHAPEESLGEVPPWQTERLEWLSEQRGARLALHGPAAPRALEGLDPGRAGRDLMPYLPNSGAVVNRRTTNWSIVPVPTVDWAVEVYPEATPEEAFERLWDAVIHVCRLDEPDPAQAWAERAGELETVAARLTERRFDALRFHGEGTDLTVGLYRSSRWQAGESTTVGGIGFHPNLPSEETFTTPDPSRTHGYATATMPKELYGSVIEGIRLEFDQGVVTRVDATRGADALRSAIARDEGASRLGEVALVDGAGRVGELDTVFLETLLDENAASHVALGNAYEIAVADDADIARLNRSQVHVDVMIGSPDLHVDGITTAGETVPLLRHGAWQI